jgi:hypothetical protein
MYITYNLLFCSSMTNLSRQRILSSLGTFRPAFRNVAQSLTDIDLVLVEENFERLLLVWNHLFAFNFHHFLFYKLNMLILY